MRLKKLISILLAVLTVICALPFASFAEDPETDSDGYILIDEFYQLQSAFRTGGKYRLNSDIERSAMIGNSMTADKVNVTLDLNGHSVVVHSVSTATYLFAVKNGASLTVYDSSPAKTGTVKYTADKKDAEKAMFDVVKSTLEIMSGNFYLESENARRGGVIHAESGSTVRVFGGYFNADNACHCVFMSRKEPREFPPHVFLYDGLFTSKHATVATLLRRLRRTLADLRALRR